VYIATLVRTFQQSSEFGSCEALWKHAQVRILPATNRLYIRTLCCCDRVVKVAPC